ncbi:MAG: hypothetical protein UGF89_01140 [Acutalibacteraceae bacterium]|nr:hypothetical protein [Acutalibacteraceae bacterium]
MYERTEEKLNNWYREVYEGKDNVFVIGLRRGEWQYIFNKSHIPIETLIVALDKGDGFKVTGLFNHPKQSGGIDKFRLIIKDKSKLIVEYENGDLASFGVKNAVSDINKIFCYAKAKNLVSIISASKEINEVNVVEKIIEGTDITTPYIFEIISNMADKPSERMNIDDWEF